MEAPKFLFCFVFDRNLSEADFTFTSKWLKVKIMRINSSSGPCSPAISEAGQPLTVQHLQSLHRQLPAQVMSLGHLYSTVLFGQRSCSGTSAPGLLEGKRVRPAGLCVSKTQTLWPFNQLPSFWLFWQVCCRAELCTDETFPLKNLHVLSQQRSLRSLWHKLVNCLGSCSESPRVWTPCPVSYTVPGPLVPTQSPCRSKVTAATIAAFTIWLWVLQ